MEKSLFCWKCGRKIHNAVKEQNLQQINKELTVGNARFQLISATRNKDFSGICGHVCESYFQKDCYSIRELNQNPESSALIATVFSMRAINTDPEKTLPMQFSMYDTKAKVYYHDINDGCLFISKDSHVPHALDPVSIADFQVYFPELPPNVNIARFCITTRGRTVTFKIAEFDPEIQSLFYNSDGDTFEDAEKSAEISKIICEKLDNVEIAERMLFIPGVDLSEDKGQIQKIQHEFQEIEKLLDLLTVRDRRKYEAMYNANRGAFNSKISAAKKHWDYAKSFSEYVNNLNNIHPREFETWCGEFFEILGYSAKVTQYAGDKGIDLYLEKDGEIFAAQCKRYAKTVAAPDVQKFLGAMVSAGIQKGFFITTSQFSVGAIAICDANNIVRYDKTRIAKTLKDLNLKP